MKKLNKISASIIVVILVFSLFFVFTTNKLINDTNKLNTSIINLIENAPNENIDDKLTFFGMDVLHYKVSTQSDGGIKVTTIKSKYHAFIPFIFAGGATITLLTISGGVWLLLAKSKRRT